MLGADHFGAEFQRILIRGCVDDVGLRALVSRFISAGQLGFNDPASMWAWRIVETNAYPTVLQLRTEAHRLAAADPVQVGITEITTTAPDVREDSYVREQVVDWCRHQVFRAGFEEARQAWNAGDFVRAERSMMARINEMQTIRPAGADRGWFFEELHERQQRRQRVALGYDYFPMHIRPLDKAMNGGLSYGELEVVVAYSKVGKTFWCVSRGVFGARMRRRVLHFVLEGGRATTEDRYESALADELFTDVRRGGIDDDVIRAMEREYAILKQNLVIRGFADRKAWNISFDEILEEMADLKSAYGWVPDMIIVDYGDLMDAQGSSPTEKQKNGFRQLKALSEMDKGYAVCSPSQAQRPSLGADEREHVVKPQQIADCYEKIRVADAIITLNRTTLEKEAEQARVYLGAYRHAEDGVLVRVKTNYSRGMFLDPDIENPPKPAGPPEE